MDLLRVRGELKEKSIYDLNLRVAYYARVSTEKDVQINSLDNQIMYYENYIKQNKNWTYVESYIDEGLSGMSTSKRENFNRMVSDGKNGQFDLLITKEISRFARNTLDSIQYTRELLTYGVGVLFQNDNICTFDEDSELRLTIMSSLAQDEIRKLSSRVKFGHQQAIKKGHVLGNSRIYGYQMEKTRLVIDEDEANMVRLVYNLYSTGTYSMKKVEDVLWEKGYRNRNGNKISHNTLSEIIANPKYKGYYVGNKVRIVDMLTKEQRFLPPEEWVMFKDETGEIVPAIVSEDIWSRANEILAKRSSDVKGRQNKCNHPNLLTGKLICTSCGVPYYRRESRRKDNPNNSTWMCSNRIKSGAKSCNSFTIYESEILPILYEVFAETSEDSKKYIDKYLEIFRQSGSPDKTQKEIKSIESKIDMANKKKSKLLDYNVLGKITDDDYIKSTGIINKEILQLESKMLDCQRAADERRGMSEQIEKLKYLLLTISKEARHEAIDKSFVDKYIDKIFVTPINDSTMRIQIKIFTGEVIDRMLSNVVLRSGQMVKKMVEKYENEIKGSK